MLPAIFGLSGESLGEEERAFLRDVEPAGFILFGRNCRDRDQLRRLTDALRDLSGRSDLPILIDQEGGRVTRLKPPEWPAFPAPRRFAELYERAPISAIEAARANAQAIAVTLGEVGVNVNCAPVLDLHHDTAHDVIGDRALGSDPLQVAALGRAVLDGLEAGGVCAVVKHMPGHGRATADSHVELPQVDAAEAELGVDIAPFKALHGAPMAITAHIRYRAWDPDQCATLSRTVIAKVVRGEIGFQGLLISDDLKMEALHGPLSERAADAIAAGCDVVLQGSGILADNVAVAGALDPIGDLAAERLERAMARARGRRPAATFESLAAKRDALLRPD